MSLAVHSEREGGCSELNHVTRVERDGRHPLLLVVGRVRGRRRLLVRRYGRDVSAGVDLGGDPEHAGVEPVAALDLHDHVAVDRPALLADELRLGLGQLLGQRGRVWCEPAVIIRRQIYHVAVRDQSSSTGQDRLVRLGLPLHGVEDLHGVDDTLEDLGEGPFDQAFQTLLKALKHTHRLLLWFREQMVSVRRTPARAPIGRTRATLPAAAEGIPFAGSPDGVISFPSLRCWATTSGEVAEWQTRTVQVRVPERA